MAKRNIDKAKEAKKDEFYTQLDDINNELKHYREHFRGKTILCNCDDPRVSNFFTYFAYNFEFLGLKKRKHSKKCTFYTLRFGCSFAAVNTIKPQLL